MWVKFLKDHDFTPAAEPRVVIAYKAGMVRNVTRECFNQAKKRGAAVETKAPPREPAASEGGGDAASGPVQIPAPGDVGG